MRSFAGRGDFENFILGVLEFRDFYLILGYEIYQRIV